MHTVGYQGVVDKVSAFYTKFLAQPWKTMFKVFNRCLTTRTSGHDQTKINILQLFHVVYPRFTKLIIVDLMKKFPSIPSRLKEDYHSVKDDIPLEIHATDDYKEYETVFVNIDVLMNLLQQVVKGEKDEESYADKFAASMIHDDDFRDRIEPGSHKEHPEVFDVDDDNKEEKKDDEMGSLENRTEKMQTPIPTTPKSPRIN
ncbi:hypothetical protein Tco_0043324, partial [Tanacetum coccineum]